MKDKFTAELTHSGYIRATPRPSQADLDEFYREQYYGQGVTDTYQVSYTEAELRQKRLRAECTLELIRQNLAENHLPRLLEIGCGEGFVVAACAAQGWNVLGVDYQLAPVEKFNPDIRHLIRVANPNEFLAELPGTGDKWDSIVLQNVLEHVLDPSALLTGLAPMLSPQGCIFLQVPNDYSRLQQKAMSEGRVDREYWFLPPQHLNYFNSENLGRFAKECGFSIVDAITDFPIEMYLWGDTENYVLNRSRGKFAHSARIALDLHLAQSGIANYVAFYRAAYKVALGRNICAILKPGR